MATENLFVCDECKTKGPLGPAWRIVPVLHYGYIVACSEAHAAVRVERLLVREPKARVLTVHPCTIEGLAARGSPAAAAPSPTT